MKAISIPVLVLTLGACGASELADPSREDGSTQESTGSGAEPVETGCAPSALYVPGCGAWHGVSPGVQSLAQFESAIGQQVDIYHEYKSFDSSGEDFPGASANAAIAGAGGTTSATAST